ncbi:hypothetical protein BJ170DRAFT_590155 [Xylariales sp. AK1849]|nr:hypothetical protein BJ170DRAFT_590155 [Xylariales sp. AK1849]
MDADLTPPTPPTLVIASVQQQTLKGESSAKKMEPTPAKQPTAAASSGKVKKAKKKTEAKTKADNGAGPPKTAPMPHLSSDKEAVAIRRKLKNLARKEKRRQRRREGRLAKKVRLAEDDGVAKDAPTKTEGVDGMHEKESEGEIDVPATDEETEGAEDVPVKEENQKDVAMEDAEENDRESSEATSGISKAWKHSNGLGGTDLIWHLGRVKPLSERRSRNEIGQRMLLGMTHWYAGSVGEEIMPVGSSLAASSLRQRRDVIHERRRKMEPRQFHMTGLRLIGTIPSFPP